MYIHFLSMNTCSWVFLTNKILELQPVRFVIAMEILKTFAANTANQPQNFITSSLWGCQDMSSYRIEESHHFHFETSYQIYFYNDLKNSCVSNGLSTTVIMDHNEPVTQHKEIYIVLEIETWSRPLENCSDGTGKTRRRYLFIEKIIETNY